MIRVHLDSIDEVTLQQLCSDQLQESLTLDFKRAAPGKDDKSKSELLKDVCALANAEGGDIVYGIDEDSEGRAQAIVAIAGESEDDLSRRIGQSLDSGIEPRITGLRIRTVRVDGGYALIVRVPASFNGPHRYSLNGNSKFVMRNGTHTSELTYGQLRDAFDRTSTLAERARQFRAARVDLIVGRRTTFPLMPGPIAVVHLVPISGLAGRSNIDVLPVYRDVGRLMFSDWTGGKCHMNFDGVTGYPTIDDQGVPAYSLLMRDGSSEFTRHVGSLINDDPTFMPSAVVTDFMRYATIRALSLTKFADMSGPAMLGYALLDVENVGWASGLHFNARSAPKGDRKNLIFPEVWIDNVDAISDVDEVVKPLLDLLWQSFGSERCPDYTPEGVWKPRP